jgi:hypothetical protein
MLTNLTDLTDHLLIDLTDRLQTNLTDLIDIFKNIVCRNEVG